jgi:hypothetical protein
MSLTLVFAERKRMKKQWNGNENNFGALATASQRSMISLR